MRRAAFLLLFLLVPLASCAQVQELTLSLDEVTRFVTLSTTLDTSKLILPEHEYTGTVSVDWAVPPEALRSLAASQVTIYVRVEPSVEDSWLYFQEGSARLRSFAFTLECRLSNNACGEGSRLSRSFVVVYRAPANAQLPREERLRLTASLVPLAPSQEFLDLQTSLQSQLSAGTLPPALQQLLQQASSLASQGEEAKAAAALEEARHAVQQIQSPESTAPASTPTLAPLSPQASTNPVESIDNALTGWAARGEAPLELGIFTLLFISCWAGWRHLRKKSKWSVDDVAGEIERENSLEGKARKLERAPEKAKR